MSNGNGSLPIGDIQFYDSYVPLLKADDYAIAVTQAVNSTDNQHPLTKSFTANQTFSVVAPRFALPPADVQSVFPPGGATGIFDQNLPQIVLTQRVLPWERLLATGGLPTPTNPNITAYPWMALLLFTADQIIPPAGTPPAGNLNNPTLVGTYAVADLLKPPSGTLGPDVEPQTEDEKTCQAIDITTATFTALTPRLSELPYLAHARQVNTGAKVTGIAMTSGWFSVVIGNRFPTAPEGSAGTLYIAHLVSLEGFATYLVDNPTWPSGIENVRLASLYSWAFTSLPEAGSFRDLMLNLVANAPKGGDTLRLRLPVTSATQRPSSPAAMVQTALQQGYAALEYDTRVGDQTFAWYHGPLVPHPLAALQVGTQFPTASAATIYDQNSGTFELSYAAGWEIGRLLALADGAYAANQQRARRAMRKVANLVRERARSAQGRALLAAPAGAGDAAALTALTALLAPKQISESFFGWLSAEMPGYIPKPGGRAVAPPATAPPRAQVVAAQSELAALLDRPDVRELLQKHVAAAMQDGPLDSVVDWLSTLRLLEGVPFTHLVPDARMLPPESIRFFYVDGNYLDALCDGAQSIGVHSSRDQAQQSIVRDAIREAAIARAYGRRASLIGRPMPEGAQVDDPVAGFLLRSAVVSGWPGLEVVAYAQSDGSSGSTVIPHVRLDHLSSDILIGLFPQVPAWIEFDEPKESLAFGVEDDNDVDLRYLSGPNIGKVNGTTVVLTSKYMRGSVLRVDSWQAYLNQQLGSPAVWGPAAFAIQMVRAPEQMIFQNQPNTQEAPNG